MDAEAAGRTSALLVREAQSQNRSTGLKTHRQRGQHRLRELELSRVERQSHIRRCWRWVWLNGLCVKEELEMACGHCSCVSQYSFSRASGPGLASEGLDGMSTEAWEEWKVACAEAEAGWAGCARTTASEFVRMPYTLTQSMVFRSEA